MRVAFLTPEVITAYGWARYAADMADALHELGVEVVALTQRDARPPETHCPLADVRPVLPPLVPPQRGFMWRSLRALNAVRRATADCDVIHVIAEPYALLGAAAAGNRVVIVTAHGTYIPMTVQRRGLGHLYRRAYRRARIIAVSTYTAKQVRAVLPGVEPYVIHNGVNYARFQKHVPPPPRSGPTILASGGVKSRKGTHILIEALAEVRAHIPDVQLVVTGTKTEDDYLARVQSLIRQHGLESCVALTGMIPEDDLLGWYQNADVFALPSLSIGSRFEGFGLVFLEAGACGLPVVGTRGSGVEDAVIPDETGILVPQGDPRAVADAITRLLADESLRHRMGAAGRAYAQSQDWAAIAPRVMTVYEN